MLKIIFPFLIFMSYYLCFADESIKVIDSAEFLKNIQEFEGVVLVKPIDSKINKDTLRELLKNSKEEKDPSKFPKFGICKLEFSKDHAYKDKKIEFHFCKKDEGYFLFVLNGIKEERLYVRITGNFESVLKN